jgi:hypothetical protein
MEQTKEHIKLETEVLPFILVAMIAVVGGTLSLGLTLMGWRRYRWIIALVERLPEDQS